MSEPLADTSVHSRSASNQPDLQEKNTMPSMEDTSSMMSESSSTTTFSETSVSSKPHRTFKPRAPVHIPPLNITERRASARSIKRKKFDDELVESSLANKTRKSSPAIENTPQTAALSPIPGAAPPTMTSTRSRSSSLSTPSSKSVHATRSKPAATKASKSAEPKTSPSRTSKTSTKAAHSKGVPSNKATAKTTSPPPTPKSPVDTGLAVVTRHKSPPPKSDQHKKEKESQKKVTRTPSLEKSPPPPPLAAERRRQPSKSNSKSRTKKSKAPHGHVTRDLGRWKPQDDLALIIGVQQTCDLQSVYNGIKFSCKFTLQEVQERWYALLYDEVISKMAVQSMKQLHPDVIASIQSKALYSKKEEELLGTIGSTTQPHLDTFQNLISQNPGIFHPARTPKALHTHWMLMKQYHLLPDQSVQPMPKGDHVLNFSDAEDMMNDDDLRDPKDEMLEHELAVSDRRQKREIRFLENEIPKWQVLVDSITGISPPDFDNQTLAVLRGRLVRYLMRSREITIGRSTKDNTVDVDLSLEGPAWKISRKQGIIKLRNNGEFYVVNEGKRPMYIDGRPVLKGNKSKLNNNAVVEISCLKFIFLINQDLISIIRTEATKMQM